MTLNIFQAGKGINATKLNANFSEVQQQANTNENNINIIANTALKKDGSNLTQTIIDDFQKQTPVVLTNQSGTISLTDNKVYFLSLSGNSTIVLPTIANDQYSHTIVLYVSGHSGYSLDLGTTNHFFNYSYADTRNPYSVMYIYNKLDNNWYYSITQ